MMTAGSICSGVEGFGLGLERAGFARTEWMCEASAFKRSVLRRHYPHTPIFDDLTALEDPPNVDCIHGGTPCQDFSTARNGGDGRRDGLDGEKSSLWWHMLRIVAAMRPRFVLWENVAGCIQSGLEAVLRSLSERGYDAVWRVVRASEVGGPHHRARVFVVAWLRSAAHRPIDARDVQRLWVAAGADYRTRAGCFGGRDEHRRGRAAGAAGVPPVGLANADLQRRAELWLPKPVPTQHLAHARPGTWARSAGYRGVDDGLSTGLDAPVAQRQRVHAMGDTIVPQVAEYVGHFARRLDEHLCAEVDATGQALLWSAA